MTAPPLVVIDAVGLTPRLLEQMPRVRRVAEEGFQAAMTPPLPAVTTTVQATFLTGLDPTDHGIVANGWYFRDLGEVFLWRQHNRLVQGEPLWEAARRARPGFRAANVCWWYAMGMTTDLTVTPRPIYYADGRKEPDCYTYPPELHDRLTGALGTFPLFRYWGAAASIESSRWIARAARSILERDRPDLLLTYLPHLDYDLQRFGPDAPQAVEAARELDGVAGELIEFARGRGATVVVVSEYGITRANRPVDVNRMLRREGLLEVYAQDGMEYLDPWMSRAFAVADHQLAHIYVRDPADILRVSELIAGLPGVESVLDEEGKRAAGLAHERSGELVAIAKPDSWFTYYYWLDDRRAPDFAKLVEIHRKPGYDPAELFMDPDDPRVKLRAGVQLARKKTGFRYKMDVVPLDPRFVQGSHGRLPADPADGPLLLCSDPSHARDTLHARDVKELLLTLADAQAPVGAAASS
ncbi:MAG TPA: nucleotide pyrophosphatase/phosphodiesterase family protein [Conexibacter sp.]|jgi:predicted AlkP superfamily pyrophosphatase or phosphodiesterase